MESVTTQDSGVGNEAWRNRFVQREQQPDNSALSFESDSPILDETIAIVKEKVWSFRSVLKSAAEALVNFGLSPTVVGYASVPLGEEEQLAEKNEAEAALQKVAEDEMLARSASSGSRPEENMLQRRAGEESRLVPRQDDEDDSNHAFIEAGRKEKDERESLTTTYDFDEEEYQTGSG